MTKEIVIQARLSKPILGAQPPQNPILAASQQKTTILFTKWVNAGVEWLEFARTTKKSRQGWSDVRRAVPSDPAPVFTVNNPRVRVGGRLLFPKIQPGARIVPKPPTTIATTRFSGLTTLTAKIESTPDTIMTRTTMIKMPIGLIRMGAPLFSSSQAAGYERTGMDEPNGDFGFHCNEKNEN